MKDFEQERREILQQKAELVLRQAACAIAEENLNEYKKAEAEAEILGAQAELPPELRRALNAAACEAETREAKKARQGRRRQRARSLTRVAVILLACVLIGGFVLTVTVDAFRIKLMDILLQDHGEYVDVNIVESGSLPPEVLAMIPEDWDELYFPGWLPEGYELVEVDGKDEHRDFIFQSDKTGYLSFSYDSSEERHIMADSEDSEMTQIQIGRSEAACLEKEGRVMLIWEQNGFCYDLLVQESKENAVKIGENIVYVPLRKK
ncbi:DUF4367 domain-containing protein [Bacilliculturomica massiliensis]|uniref:DUF4367 domain-containing protein n=1 Tax=Bacilliculturomica massiliensis TaxID=1917867 RepID=UPI00103031B1|nr:DUF4367 domain-containing protein [Bacilliculturomica massiliensis]